MTYVIGIDGGGSTVRVVVTTPDLTIVGEATGTTANPNLVGRDVASQTIESAVRDALASAHLTVGDIAAVGLGIAGADAAHSEVWLREVMAAILPEVRVAPSSDYEIALVGAHGQRKGMLVLSGTGSLACGVGSEGALVVVGARGYLAGDEGSGYWIGMEGLKAAIRDDDGRARRTTLKALLFQQFGLPNINAVIPWLYHTGISHTKDIATFANTVLQQAEYGDSVAADITLHAAEELALAVRAVHYRLSMEALPIAYAGGLLSFANPLSLKLCELLGLPDLPVPRYPAVIGGAILALSKLGLNPPT
jgi:N-acetylglucosamine kinase-like BadF-type ATPase